jgi:ATP-dependent DNA ligase
MLAREHPAQFVAFDLLAGEDGASLLDLLNQPGRRLQKFKRWKTVDCVVGDVYYRPGSRDVEYLLMGLCDDAAQPNYIARWDVHGHGRELAEMLRPPDGGCR